MADLIVVHCATSSIEEAEAIASILLDAKLAACIQISPVVSYYVWQGKRTRDHEQLMLIKTRAELFDSVCECIRATHSYETPEITAVPILRVDPAYRAWVEASTRSQ
jgi:periplasmic divalent cation tolerance protein